MRSIVPRIRTVSCADAGKAIETEMKLTAASRRRDLRDMFALPEFELTADGSVVGTKAASPGHFATLPLQPRGSAYIPGRVAALSASPEMRTSAGTSAG